jgi:hypothetical protein
MKKTILVVVVLAIVVAAAYYLYPRPQSVPTLPTQTNQTSTASIATSSIVTLVTPTSTPTSSMPQIFTSSSSAQVGKFTVVTDCDASNGQTIVEQIGVFEGGVLKQTVSDQSLDLGPVPCPKPDARDINSDGYPDFSVVYNFGNEYTDSVYWLYNSSTDEFSCPNPAPSGKPWMACYLVEPN